MGVWCVSGAIVDQVDDVVDASVVHGLCGLWGMIATGLFTTEVGYARAYDEVRIVCSRPECVQYCWYYGGPSGTLF